VVDLRTSLKQGRRRRTWLHGVARDAGLGQICGERAYKPQHGGLAGRVGRELRSGFERRRRGDGKEAALAGLGAIEQRGHSCSRQSNHPPNVDIKKNVNRYIIHGPARRRAGHYAGARDRGVNAAKSLVGELYRLVVRRLQGNVAYHYRSAKRFGDCTKLGLGAERVVETVVVAASVDCNQVKAVCMKRSADGCADATRRAGNDGYRHVR